jgi:transcriptional regulator with XRE-family HTH domain
MHVQEVTYDELAEELGVGKSYVSMILNGRRNPPEAKERLQAAFDRVLMKRKFPEA